MQRYKTLDRIDELELSMYQDVSEIPDIEGDYDSTVTYVRDIRDGKLYIKKELKNVDKDVYEGLLEFEEINARKLPGVPKIVSVTDAGNTVYVIEEFINCPTLRKIIESHAMSVDTLALIFREVSIILERLHKGKNPITHGSISDTNILVNMDAIKGNTKEQKVFLVDFDCGEKHLLKADVSKDIQGACSTLKSCMDTIMLKSITELDGELWDGLKDIAENGPTKYATDRQMMIDIGKLIGKRAPRVEKPKKKNYTLPGFRTKKLWKMIVAIIGYLLMIGITIISEPYAEPESLKTYQEVCYFMLMFSYPMWFCNYLGVQDKYKWLKEGNILQKIIVHIIVAIAIMGFWAVVSELPHLIEIFYG